MVDTLLGLGTTQEVTFLREEILVRRKRSMLCCPRIGGSKLQISLWTIFTLSAPSKAHYGAFIYSI